MLTSQEADFLQNPSPFEGRENKKCVGVVSRGSSVVSAPLKKCRPGCDLCNRVHPDDQSMPRCVVRDSTQGGRKDPYKSFWDLTQGLSAEVVLEGCSRKTIGREFSSTVCFQAGKSIHLLTYRAQDEGVHTGSPQSSRN